MAVGPLENIRHPILKKRPPHLPFESYFSFYIFHVLESSYPVTLSFYIFPVLEFPYRKTFSFYGFLPVPEDFEFERKHSRYWGAAALKKTLY